MSLKIYFAGSVTGGREYADFYTLIIDYLKKYGEVLTEHLSGKNKNLSEKGEAALNLEPTYIYERDVDWLSSADVLVAEVTTPSLGVGYELCYAEKMNKPILCLFNRNSQRTLSAMVRGNKNFKVVFYSNEEELRNAIDSFFEQLKSDS